MCLALHRPFFNRFFSRSIYHESLWSNCYFRSFFHAVKAGYRAELVQFQRSLLYIALPESVIVPWLLWIWSDQSTWSWLLILKIILNTLFQTSRLHNSKKIENPRVEFEHDSGKWSWCGYDAVTLLFPKTPNIHVILHQQCDV